VPGPAGSTRPASNYQAGHPGHPLGDGAPFDYARPVAAALIDQAISPTAVPETGSV
jgi:hypothetical protein